MRTVCALRTALLARRTGLLDFLLLLPPLDTLAVLPALAARPTLVDFLPLTSGWALSSLPSSLFLPARTDFLDLCPAGVLPSPSALFFLPVLAGAPALRAVFCFVLRAALCAWEEAAGSADALAEAAEECPATGSTTKRVSRRAKPRKTSRGAEIGEITTLILSL